MPAWMRRLKLSAIIKILVTNQRFSMGLPVAASGWGIPSREGEGQGKGKGRVCKYLRTRAAKLRKLHAGCSMQHVALSLPRPLSISLSLLECVRPFQVTCAVHRIRLHTGYSSCSCSCEGFGLAFSLCGMRPLLVYFINSTGSHIARLAGPTSWVSQSVNHLRRVEIS